MYSKESDASIAITVDAFFVNMAIPFFKESCNVTTVVCEIFTQTIIKSADVGALLDHVFDFAKL